MTKVVIERAIDGSFSASATVGDSLFIGVGATTKEVIKDIREVIAESYPDLDDFQYVYDAKSFLGGFRDEMSLSGLEVITGISQKVLGHYLSGYRNPSKKVLKKIEDGIHEYASALLNTHIE